LLLTHIAAPTALPTSPSSPREHTALITSRLLIHFSWDDWVPEDRLRKLTPENRDLANNLRHEMLAAQRAATKQVAASKKKPQGSTRGSEERQMSVQATGPRGQKRMRDNDLEKVTPNYAALVV
jgi:hypothetical protein